MIEFNIRLISILIILFGAINLGIVGIFDYNMIETFGKLFGTNSIIFQKIIYCIIGFAALYMLINKYTYMPILDRTLIPDIPEYLDKDRINSDFYHSETIENLPPNTKIIYWQTQWSLDIKDIDYDNIMIEGIVKSNNKGEIVVHLINSPVLDNKTFYSHIYLRYWTSKHILSPLITLVINK
jgi:uncharacterized membrane protein YuzA (DUF378 family)